MIGFLLALALLVGCPVGVAHERAQAAAVAVCVESRAAAMQLVVRPRERATTSAPRVARPLPVVRPRTMDLRHGGLPQPRAPDLVRASPLLG